MGIERLKKFKYGDLCNIFIILLAIIFVCNLLHTNSVLAYNSNNTDKNRKLVAKMQTASVLEVERAVDELDKATNSGTISENRKNRYKKMFKDYVVIGDSLTEGLSAFDWLSDDQVFSKVGASVLNSDDIVNQAVEIYPECAFFAFGMNDMGNFSGDSKAFVKRYRSMIKAFEKKSPNTRIYVCSISTPSKTAIKNTPEIGDYKKFNSAIKKMCAKMNIPFIDTSYILEKNTELYAKDGIHASSEYYPIWMDDMIEEANADDRK